MPRRATRRATPRQATEPVVQNRVLRALRDDAGALLLGQGEDVTLVAGQVIYEPEHVQSHVYFPEDAVISHVCCSGVDAVLEVAMVGREGLVGLPMLSSVPTTVSRVLVQIPGRARRVRASAVRRALAESEPFRQTVSRFTQALLDQVMLCAACNVGHTPLERCARWLLMIHDRVQTEPFPVTQEFLAYMLGMSRQTVSSVASRLQTDGLIEYRRGRVCVTDRRGLERVACPCYQAIAARVALLLGPARRVASGTAVTRDPPRHRRT